MEKLANTLLGDKTRYHLNFKVVVLLTFFTLFIRIHEILV